MDEIFADKPIPRRFHVQLTVRVAATGVFVGRITDEPLPEDEAIGIKDAYADNILNAESLTLPAIGHGDNATLVLPLDVLRRSVLLFQLEEVVAPVAAAELLDFGPTRGRRTLAKDKDV